MNIKVGQYFFSKKHQAIFKIMDTRQTNKGTLFVCEWPSGRPDGRKITSYYADRIQNETELVPTKNIKNFQIIYGGKIG